MVISLGIMAGLADVAYWRLKMQQLEKESQAEIAELQNTLLETDSLRQQAEARAVAAEAEVADATLKLKRTERKVEKTGRKSSNPPLVLSYGLLLHLLSVDSVAVVV